MFVIVGASMFLMFQAFAVSLIYSGRQMRRRIRYTFTFVMACLACMCMPFGTVLGVLTLIVLSRPSVKSIYGVRGP
jgi:hypothetical protein